MHDNKCLKIHSWGYLQINLSGYLQIPFRGYLKGRGYCPERFRTITSYCMEGFRTITSYCPEPLSNVRRCWLAMPLGAGFLR